MASILILTGSPSDRSRTSALAEHVGDELVVEGHDVTVLRLRDLPADAAAGGVGRSVRLAIVGDALALRVAHFQLPAVQLVATAPDAAGVIEALQGSAVDVLLCELPTLQRESAPEIRALARQVAPQQIVVEYGYGRQGVEQELRDLGCSLVRAPLEADQLAALCRPLPAAPRARLAILALFGAVGGVLFSSIPPRRRASTARPSPRFPWLQWRSTASARITSPSCSCSWGISKPTAPSARIAVQPTPSCTAT